MATLGSWPRMCAGSWGIKKLSQAVEGLDEDEQSRWSLLMTPHGTPPRNCDYQSSRGSTRWPPGLASPKPKGFAWVWSEVLPALRKTGSYTMGQENRPEDGPLVKEALHYVELARQTEVHQREIEALKEARLNAALQRIEDLERINAGIQAAKDAAQLAQVEAKHAENYVSVLGHASMNGIVIPDPAPSQIGKIASRMCREKGIPIGKTTNVRYGECNTYPRDIVCEAFLEYSLKG